MFTMKAAITTPLTVQNICATWATLKISHHTAKWWYQGDQSGAACTEVAAGTSTATLTLTTGTTYTYRAYSATGCAAANEIDAVTFTTP